MRVRLPGAAQPLTKRDGIRRVVLRPPVGAQPISACHVLPPLIGWEQRVILPGVLPDALLVGSAAVRFSGIPVRPDLPPLNACAHSAMFTRIVTFHCHRPYYTLCSPANVVNHRT